MRRSSGRVAGLTVEAQRKSARMNKNGRKCGEEAWFVMVVGGILPLPRGGIRGGIKCNGGEHVMALRYADSMRLAGYPPRGGQRLNVS